MVHVIFVTGDFFHVKHTEAVKGLRTSDFRLLTSDFGFHTSDFGLHIIASTLYLFLPFLMPIFKQ